MIQRSSAAARAAPPPPAPREQVARRLDAYSRYGEILAAQLDALSRQDPDIERFTALAEERAALAAGIDESAVPVADPQLAESPEVRDLLVRIRDQLQHCQRTDAAVIRRLGELRQETADALDAMDTRKAARSGYGSATHGPVPATLDVRS
jgi:hypothetical protein